jgi:long-chain acyl-CoA synthetase
MKLRRDEIVRTYALEIDAMYAARSHRRPERAPREPAGWEDADNVFLR